MSSTAPTTTASESVSEKKSTPRPVGWKVLFNPRGGGAAAEVVPVVVALVVAFVVFRLASSEFLTSRNVVNLLTQLPPLVLLAVASALVIVMGEIDLSLGSVAGFCGALGATLLLDSGLPWEIAVLATLAAGIAVSAAQGALVVIGRVRSFAVTIAGFFVWYGVQLWILGTDGQKVVTRLPVANLSSARVPEPTMLTIVIAIGGILIVTSTVLSLRDEWRYRLSGQQIAIRAGGATVLLAAAVWLVTYLNDAGGVPLIFVIVVAITAGMWLILTRTALGRHFYAVGGSDSASMAMGIPVQRVKWIGFAVVGLLVAFAGLAIASYTGEADTSTGGGSLLLEGIGAAVVGGVSLTGGRGSVWGAFGGAVLLAAVENGLALLNLNYYVVDIAEGGVVLLALLADSAFRRKLVSR